MSALSLEEKQRIARLLVAALGEAQTKLLADAVKRLGDTPEARAVLEVAVTAARGIRPDLAKIELEKLDQARPELRPDPPGQARRGWRSRTRRLQ